MFLVQNGLIQLYTAKTNESIVSLDIICNVMYKFNVLSNFEFDFSLELFPVSF